MLAVSFSCNVNKITRRYSSICSQMFLKVGALKSFANFTGKQLRWKFNKVAGPSSPATLLKETPTQVFSCEICEKHLFLQYTLGSCFLRYRSNSNNLFNNFLAISAIFTMISKFENVFTYQIFPPIERFYNIFRTNFLLPGLNFPVLLHF